MSKRRYNGEGTIRKRPDGRWECTVMIGFQEDGRRKGNHVLQFHRAALLVGFCWMSGFVSVSMIGIGRMNR